MDTHRAQRLSEAIREELSEIIGYETDDPRLLSVTVTEVHLSPDARKAHVAVNVGSAPSPDDAMAALEAARHFLRRELTARIDIYRIPELYFELDTDVAPTKIDFLLRRIRKGRPREEAGPQDEKKTVS
jgi:ribosome-binding factor A